MNLVNSIVGRRNVDSSSKGTISRLRVPLMALLLMYATTSCKTNEEKYDSSNDINPKMTELLNEYKNIFNENLYRHIERKKVMDRVKEQIDTAKINVEKNIPKLMLKIERELGVEGDSLKNALVLFDLNTASTVFADNYLNKQGYNTTLNVNVDYTDNPNHQDEIDLTTFFAAIDMLGAERAALEASGHKIKDGEKKNTYNTEKYAVFLDAGRMRNGMEIKEITNENIHQNAYFFNNEDLPSVETIRETRPGGVVVVTHPNMNPDIIGYLSYLVESGIKVYAFCVDSSLNPVDIDQDQLADLMNSAQKDPETGYTSGHAYHKYHSHSGGFYPWYVYSHMYHSPSYYSGSRYTTKSVTYVHSNGSRAGMTGKSFKGSSSTFGGRSSGIGRGG